MKSVWLICLTLGFSFAASAQQLDIVCKPKQPLSAPMRVEWNTLLELRGFEFKADLIAKKTEVKMSALMHDEFENKDLEITESFDLLRNNGEFFVLTPSKGSELKFQSAVFAVTKLNAPMSAGPVPPGTWPAEGSLVLISSALSNGKKEVADVNVALTCSYNISYGSK